MKQDKVADITDLAPSAKLVYKVLQHNGGLTQKQIAEESMLPPRTVRFALDQLEEAGIISEDIHIPDARQQVYQLK